MNAVRLGIDRLSEGGSFTLTSGILGRRPVPGSTAFSLVNGGLEAFVRAAALDLPRGPRVNVVSPGWLSETLAAMGKDPAGGTPGAVVARSYREAIEGSFTGRVLEVPAGG